MPANETSPWTAFWKSVSRFEPEKVTPWLALRNTLGVALPLAAGVAVGALPAAVAVSAGALNVSFSDSHDPYSARARKMLAASVLVAVAVWAGAFAGQSYWLGAALAAACAFAAGMAVALGTTAADLGVISLVTLVVFEARQLPVDEAAFAGLLAFAGGLLETLLALAFWPLQRYVPEREALAAFYRELAGVAAAAPPAPGVWQAPPASGDSTRAQTALAGLHRDHSVEAERYLLLLGQAERMRLSLLALLRLRTRIERADGAAPENATIARYLQIAARMLGSLADSLASGTPAEAAPDCLRELTGLADALRVVAPSSGERPELEALKKDARIEMDALTGQLRAALDLSASITPAGIAAFERREASRPWTLRLGGVWATLRANLNLESAAFRHAVRLAVCIALGDALARGLGLSRSYWLPMTIAIVLKPDFTGTFSRGALRLAGTFACLLVVTGIAHVLPARAGWQVALIAAAMFALRCWGPANYGIFTTAVTALVVLLLGLTGAPPVSVVGARAWNTAAGGAIALAAYWLWPTWERTQVWETLARMLDAYRDYFRTIRESYETPEAARSRELDRARFAARLARSNLEASIDRISAEPGAPEKTVAALGALLATSHRLVHAIMALEAGLSSSRPVPPWKAFRPFANNVELTLYYLAAALRGSPLAAAELPDLRESHNALIHSGDSLSERYALVNVETDRIVNSLNTLSGEALRWIEAG